MRPPLPASSTCLTSCSSHWAGTYDARAMVSSCVLLAASWARLLPAGAAPPSMTTLLLPGLGGHQRPALTPRTCRRDQHDRPVDRGHHCNRGVRWRGGPGPAGHPGLVCGAARLQLRVRPACTSARPACHWPGSCSRRRLSQGSACWQVQDGLSAWSSLRADARGRWASHACMGQVPAAACRCLGQQACS